MSILDILHTLPSLDYANKITGGRDPSTWPDWFISETVYPYYEILAEITKPKRIAEIGALVGYSLISLIHGSPCIEEVYWIDDESYLPQSNALCKENLDYYLSITKKQIKKSFDFSIFGLKRFDIGYFDLIHIDGDHSFEGCKRDIQIAFALNPLYIIIDDYYKFSGVNDAIHTLCSEISEQCKVIQTKDRGLVFVNNQGCNSIFKFLAEKLPIKNLEKK